MTERAMAICLLQVLKEYSDEHHIMTRSQISEKMRKLYGIDPDRRTIYSAVDVLTELGYDISTYEDNHIGYYLVRDPKTDFDINEVRLLSDAVCAFPFISAKHTEQLRDKLQAQVSVYERRHIKNLSIIKPERKTENWDVFFSIEMIDEAIQKKVKVKFDYMEYHEDLELHKRREKKFTVNPYSMVFTNEHYYLVAVLAYQKTVSMYRIDRMKNIEITNYALDVHEDGFEPEKEAAVATYAYAGKPERIEMLTDRKNLGAIVDKFGTDLRVVPQDDGRLKVSMTAAPAGIRYWAMQYLEEIEIISPKSLREEIVRMLKANLYTETDGEQ